MSQENYNRSRQKAVLWIMFGTMIFITVIFPFFLSNLRYQASLIFSALFLNFFYTIGRLCLFFGILLLVFGFFSLICKRSNRGLSLMITALFFIIVGSFFTGMDFLTFIVGSNVPSISNGYE